jgi:hypothetical protein
MSVSNVAPPRMSEKQFVTEYYEKCRERDEIKVQKQKINEMEAANEVLKAANEADKAANLVRRQEIQVMKQELAVEMDELFQMIQDILGKCIADLTTTKTQIADPTLAGKADKVIHFITRGIGSVNATTGTDKVNQLLKALGQSVSLYCQQVRKIKPEFELEIEPMIPYLVIKV